MNLNKCDKCGKDTWIHPPTEPQFEEKLMPYNVPLLDEDGEVIIKQVQRKDEAGQPMERPVYQRDLKGGIKLDKDSKRIVENMVPAMVGEVQYEVKQIMQRIPKMLKTVARDPHSHKEVKTEVQELKDLKARALFLQCRIVGRDVVERDFCVPCFDKYVKPEFTRFMNFLNTFERQ